MPYKIFKRVGGYGVKKDEKGAKFLSKKPQTLEKAKAQKTAVEIAERKRNYKINKK